jgi:hypothetical protein
VCMIFLDTSRFDKSGKRDNSSLFQSCNPDNDIMAELGLVLKALR